jgi:hypothetical protein|tara:strand:+ start:4816 stop:5070 length:255 start_codon:yes stop_codon:yes gene_type:complete
MSAGEPIDKISPENFIHDNIRGLMADTRSEYLIMLIKQQQEALVVYLSDPRCAGDHGKLAHAAGGVDALASLVELILGIKNGSE